MLFRFGIMSSKIKKWMGMICGLCTDYLCCQKSPSSTGLVEISSIMNPKTSYYNKLATNYVCVQKPSHRLKCSDYK
jgi:hypothetical protein